MVSLIRSSRRFPYIHAGTVQTLLPGVYLLVLLAAITEDRRRINIVDFPWGKSARNLDCQRSSQHQAVAANSRINICFFKRKSVVGRTPMSKALRTFQ